MHRLYERKKAITIPQTVVTVIITVSFLTEPCKSSLSAPTMIYLIVSCAGENKPYFRKHGLSLRRYQYRQSHFISRQFLQDAASTPE